MSTPQPWASFQRWIGNTRFGRNAWKIARAQAVAQALPLVAAPLLTRLYGPEAFGALAVFVALVSLLLAAATGRWEWSVPSARSSRTAAAALCLGALVMGAVTALLVFVALLAPDLLVQPWSTAAGLVGAGSATPATLLAGLLILAVLGGGAHQLVQAWHVRQAELSLVGRAKMAQAFCNVFVSIAAAGLGAMGLVAATVVSGWVGIRMLWRRAPSLTRALRRQSRRTLVLALHRHGAEAGWSTVASVLNAASLALLPLLLARHYGAAEVGYYALMQRLAFAPISLMATALSQSFWAEAARLVRTDPVALSRLWHQTSLRLCGVALPLSVAALLGPLYVGPLFGAEQWAPAGWVLAASVPVLVGQLVVSPLSHLIVHGRQRSQAIWDAVRIAVLVLLVEGMGRAGSPFTLTVLAASTASALLYLLLWCMNRRALAAAVAVPGAGRESR